MLLLKLLIVYRNLVFVGKALQFIRKVSQFVGVAAKTIKPFTPHLNGSCSTQVSRLLHTSVPLAPHKCGLSLDL